MTTTKTESSPKGVPIREGIETSSRPSFLRYHPGPKGVPIREGIETKKYSRRASVQHSPKGVPIREGIETFLNRQFGFIL